MLLCILVLGTVLTSFVAARIILKSDRKRIKGPYRKSGDPFPTVWNSYLYSPLTLHFRDSQIFIHTFCLTLLFTLFIREQFFGQKPSDEAGYRTRDLSEKSQTRNLLRHSGHLVPHP
jgi:hypothetical protein